MASRKYRMLPARVDAPTPPARTIARRAAPAREQAATASGPQAVRALQRQIGNRATARLLNTPHQSTLARKPAATHAAKGALARVRSKSVKGAIAGRPGSSVQRVFAIKDMDGVDHTKFDADFISEARFAIRDNLSAIEKQDFMDFPGVWGNFLENAGVFEAYLKQLYESSQDFGNFDLSKVDEVIALYFRLKTLVLKSGEPEAEEETVPENVPEEVPEEVLPEAPKDEAPIDADFTPSQILFASVSGGKVGSIYFPAGRIRLTHPDQPEISKHAGIERYALSDKDYARYKQYKKHSKLKNTPEWRKYYRQWKTRHSYVRDHLKAPMAVSGGGGRLVEFWPPKGSHPSRGGPEPFPYALSQAQLNIIYNAALARSNAVLKLAMAGDPLLSTIPIN